MTASCTRLVQPGRSWTQRYTKARLDKPIELRALIGDITVSSMKDKVCLQGQAILLELNVKSPLMGGLFGQAGELVRPHDHGPVGARLRARQPSYWFCFDRLCSSGQCDDRLTKAITDFRVSARRWATRFRIGTGSA